MTLKQALSLYQPGRAEPNEHDFYRLTKAGWTNPATNVWVHAKYHAKLRRMGVALPHDEVLSLPWADAVAVENLLMEE